MSAHVIAFSVDRTSKVEALDAIRRRAGEVYRALPADAGPIRFCISQPHTFQTKTLKDKAHFKAFFCI